MVVGAYANQRLNLVANGKAHGRETKTSNRTWEIRPSGIIGGAFENVALVEMRSQLAIERAGLVTLHLQLARRSSIPTIDLSVPCGQAGQRCLALPLRLPASLACLDARVRHVRTVR